MKIKSIAPWFGGKRSMAPAIVTELGKHSQYFEPFCGSLAVVFAKPRSLQETVCDLHADATNLAWVLQIRELYDGWTFMDHARQKNLHIQNGRGARPKQAPEVLIINGESYA